MTNVGDIGDILQKTHQGIENHAQFYYFRTSEALRIFSDVYEIVEAIVRITLNRAISSPWQVLVRVS